MEWKYATIFISSSFIDMHAERDYLIKKVFPELEEWCEKHKIHLSNIDLRWGVPEDVSNNNSTIEKCLLNIDKSRPFFLCFLAQRRGWIPDFNKDISEDTFKRYEQIKEYNTEMEIEHALLSPLKDFLDGNDTTLIEHSLFFVRDKSSLNDITDAQKRVYTNYELVDLEKGEFIHGEYEDGKCIKEAKIIDDLSEETIKSIQDADNASQEIIDRIIDLKKDEDEKDLHIEISKYTGDWNKNLKIPEIEAIERFSDEEWQGRLTNFRAIDENYADISLLEVSENINPETDVPLKDVIIKQLMAHLKDEFPENFEEEEPKSKEEKILQDELNQQDNFAHLNSQGYIERKEDIDKLNEYIADDDENRICLVSSEAGYGKTMLLANFATMLEREFTNKFEKEKENRKTIYKRFCGASNLSSKAFSLWDTIIRESKINEEDDFETPTNMDELKRAIPDILNRISKKGDSVIIIDAVNQMPDGLEMLKWLPAPESSNLKIIISCKEDEEDEAYAKKLRTIKERNAICPYSGEDKNYSFKLKALETDDENMVKTWVKDLFWKIYDEMPNEKTKELVFWDKHF